MSQENEATYRFTLKGEGIDVAKQVGLPIARQLLNVALGGESPHAPTVPSTKDRAGSLAIGAYGSLVQDSLREFLDSVAATRNPEKIVAIAEYLTVRENRADVSKDEVLGQFRVARESVPANFSRDFAWALSNGWIAEDAHNRGRFYVTKSGKAAIQAGFSREIKKKSAIRPARRRRTSSSAAQK